MIKERPILFWSIVAVVVFLCVFTSVYAALNVFSNKRAASATAVPSETSISPTQTPLPTETRVVGTVIPGLTSISPTAIPPSATNVAATLTPSATSVGPTPTSKPSATPVPPTAKPSATKVPPTAVPPTKVPPTVEVNPVQNIIWRWLTVTQLPTNDETTVTGTYTITFYPDGTLSGIADCNTFGGIYSQARGFTIEITAATASFCGEKSLDQEYIQLLNEVVTGGPDGLGNLALETAGGAERMLFANGGAAVQP